MLDVTLGFLEMRLEHFLMSLEKSVDRVMMMTRPMFLMSWVGVSADLAASAMMFAYSFKWL
jgi:hypothetical protein